MRLIRYLPAAWVVMVVSACHLGIFGWDDRDLDEEATEPFSASVDAADDVSLRLENVNGVVDVLGDFGSTTAEIEAVRRVRSDTRADAEQFLARVWVEVSEQGDAIVVRTDQPSDADGREVTVDYQLTIPSYLDVRVANVNGEVHVASFDASVIVSNANGSVSVGDVFGDVDVALVNGDIVAEVKLPSEGRVELVTVNGNVTLAVPASISAMLDAHVVNGTISVQGLTVVDANTSTHSVEGRLGSGDGWIEVSTTNGTVTLRAR